MDNNAVVEALEKARELKSRLRGCNALCLTSDVDAIIAALKQSLAQPAQEDRDVPEAIRLLGLLMDGWENGIACYEDPEECAGYLGSAFKLDDETFDACCNLLNRRKPPRGTVLKNGMLVAPQPSAPVVPEGEYLCPNCVTPWKCNGPHIPEPAQRDERSLCLAAWKNSEHYQHAYPDSIKRELFAEGWQAAIASRSKP